MESASPAIDKNSSDIATLMNASDLCQDLTLYRVGYSIVDLITFLVGFSVITKLMFIAARAKNTIDILNFNLSIFHMVQYILTLNDLLGIYFFPRYQTVLRSFLFGYCVVGGPLNLLFISMERYVAVVYPTSYPLLKKYRYREIGSVAVWLIAVPSSLLQLFLHVDRHEVPVILVILALMFWFNMGMVRVLKKSGPGKNEIHPKTQRAINTTRAVFLMVMLCYNPVAAVLLVYRGNSVKTDCLVQPLCVLLLSAASIVHPLFYLSTQGRLRPCCTKQGE